MKVTEILAIYAALLSTFVFIWNIHRAIPRYKVEVVFGSDEIDGEWVHGIYISVKNPSPHSVHLSNVSILYPYKKMSLFEFITDTLKYRRFPMTLGWVHSSLSNYDIDDGCPLTLEPGKSHGILVPDSALKKISEDNEKRVIKVMVQDQLWRNKYSRKFIYT